MKIYLDDKKLEFKSMPNNFDRIVPRFNGAILNYAFHNVCGEMSRLIEFQPIEKVPR